MKEQDLFLRRIYTHKGISVAVDIDLVNKQISLVEKMGDNSFRHKSWLFAERELKYVQGWLNILDAMKYAMTEAAKELQVAEERDEKKFVKFLTSLNDNWEDTRYVRRPRTNLRRSGF